MYFDYHNRHGQPKLEPRWRLRESNSVAVTGFELLGSKYFQIFAWIQQFFVQIFSCCSSFGDIEDIEEKQVYHNDDEDVNYEDDDDNDDDKEEDDDYDYNDHDHDDHDDDEEDDDDEEEEEEEEDDDDGGKKLR